MSFTVSKNSTADGISLQKSKKLKGSKAHTSFSKPQDLSRSRDGRNSKCDKDDDGIKVTIETVQCDRILPMDIRISHTPRSSHDSMTVPTQYESYTRFLHTQTSLPLELQGTQMMKDHPYLINQSNKNLSFVESHQPQMSAPLALLQPTEAAGQTHYKIQDNTVHIQSAAPGNPSSIYTELKTAQQPSNESNFSGFTKLDLVDTFVSQQPRISLPPPPVIASSSIQYRLEERGYFTDPISNYADGNTKSQRHETLQATGDQNDGLEFCGLDRNVQYITSTANCGHFGTVEDAQRNPNAPDLDPRVHVNQSNQHVLAQLQQHAIDVNNNDIYMIHDAKRQSIKSSEDIIYQSQTIPDMTMLNTAIAQLQHAPKVENHDPYVDQLCRGKKRKADFEEAASVDGLAGGSSIGCHV